MGYEQINFFRGALGLNTRAAPSRLVADPETGMCELAQAINVDVDQFYRICRRPGAKGTICSVSAHSLFTALNHTVFVSGTDLCRLENDYNHTVLANLTSESRMSYLHLPDMIFFSNGQDKGVIDLDTWSVHPWEAGTYHGPRTDREFHSPPPGQLLEIYLGRIFIAANDVVWYTEPYAYHWVDYSENFLVQSSWVTMLRAVNGGMFIGTTTGLFFLQGNFERLDRISSAAVVIGTDVLCEKDDLQRDLVEGIRQTGPGIICTSNEGILFLGEGGFVRNLTKDRLEYPVQNEGTAYISEGKYVVIME